MALKTAMIGLGKQAVADHLPAVSRSEQFELLAAVDIDREKANAIASTYGVPGFTSIEEMLAHVNIDVAIVTLPHCSYLQTIERLATHRVHIIKEKPFSTNLVEAKTLQSIIRKQGIYIGVTVQRRFNPIFQSFHQLKRRIGKIYSVEGRYTMNVPDLEHGWRASKVSAGGGALIDMGYHFIDLLLWYFGLPHSVTALFTRGNRPSQSYDVEDTAHLSFDYQFADSPDEKTPGHLVISRVYPYKEEKLTVYGTEGIIEVSRGCIRRLDCQGEEIERLERKGSWPSAAIDQLEFFAKQIQQFQPGQEVPLHEHLGHVALIHAAYESDRLGRSCDPHFYLEQLTTAEGGILR